MNRPIITDKDLFTNPTLQSAPTPMTLVPGASHLRVDGQPILTGQDIMNPSGDKALPIPNGVFYKDQPVAVPQNPTQLGGSILSAAPTRTVIL